MPRRVSPRPRRRFAMGMGKSRRREKGNKRGDDGARRRVKWGGGREKEKRRKEKKKPGRKSPPSRRSVQAVEDGQIRVRQTAEGRRRLRPQSLELDPKCSPNPRKALIFPLPAPVGSGFAFWSSRSSGPSVRRHAEWKTQREEKKAPSKTACRFYFAHSGSLLTSLSFLYTVLNFLPSGVVITPAPLRELFLNSPVYVVPSVQRYVPRPLRLSFLNSPS